MWLCFRLLICNVRLRFGGILLVTVGLVYGGVCKKVFIIFQTSNMYTNETVTFFPECVRRHFMCYEADLNTG